MTKKMSIWLVVTMSMMFLFMGAAGFFISSEHSPGAVTACVLLSAFFFLLLMGGTVGVMIAGTLLNAYVRRTGTRHMGSVLHARPAGYVNYRPNWALEIQLDDGRTARMQATRSGGFFPGEPIQLLVGSGNPARAVFPPEVSSRPSF